VIPGQTGQLATAENVDDLAQTISMLVDDPGSRAKYGLLARQLMEQAFEISKQTERYCELYRDLTQSLDARNVA
jgi:glycosyltransferase involved in cell wall biosynthesis